MKNFIYFLVLLTILTLQHAALGKRKTKMSESGYKIFVSHPEVPKDAIDLLSQKCEIIQPNTIPTRADILDQVKGVHGIFWATHEKLDSEVLNAAGAQLKSISTMSAGVDNVDVAECKRRKIPLGHTPTVLNTAVADLAVGLMIAAARRFHEGRTLIEADQWVTNRITWMWGQEIRDATVGFYGFGGISQTIAKRLAGFDIGRIIYNTRRKAAADVEKEFNASWVNFNDLLQQSDILFLVVPLTNETQGVFNKTAFAKMKNTAVLVNVARGKVVNTADLYEALKTNQIFSAGLDVIDPEPLSPTADILKLPNLVISPHLGSATQRTRTEMSVIAAHNVLRGLAGEPMFAPVYTL